MWRSDLGLDAEAQADFYPSTGDDVLGGRRVGLPAGGAQVLYYNTSLRVSWAYTSRPKRRSSSRARRAAQPNLSCATMTRTTTQRRLDRLHQLQRRIGLDVRLRGRCISPDGSLSLRYPQVQAAMTSWSLLDEGCAWISESQPPEGEFAGRLGCFPRGAWRAFPTRRRLSVAAVSPDRWSILPFPGENGEGVMPVYGPAFQCRFHPGGAAGELAVRQMADRAWRRRSSHSKRQLPVREGSLEHMGLLPQAHPQ